MRNIYLVGFSSSPEAVEVDEPDKPIDEEALFAVPDSPESQSEHRMDRNEQKWSPLEMDTIDEDAIGFCFFT